ncbi:putative DEAD box helicase family protein [Lyophyllum shimeji]|uniref:DEAD box helicase family protein n=1 Tax=Lyophyllum shimeji TaxID=47721 RepID=A0A9P3UI54_LYOSH|nr:putative DEAD box helicase family protein [Lyophyllum shimeji]
MTGTKRAVLSADDLLRKLEEPRRKKARLSLLTESDSDDAPFGKVKANRTESRDGDSSDEERSIDDDENDEDDDEEDDEGEGDDDHDDDDDDADADEADANPRELLVVQDRFGSSLKSRQQNQFKETTQPTESKAVTFTSLGISGPLQAALSSMSIRTPTEVQAACIPPLLAVLGPSLNIRTAVVVGGMDMMAQALELRDRPHVVIATPGRIVDHLRSSSGEWDLSRVKFLVLDEADRLLTQTFASELAYLFGVLPQNRQTCLFTATLTPSIETLANAQPRPGKQKPFIHRMTETVETVSTLQQHYLLVPSHVREPYLYYLLCHPPESIAHMRRAPPEPVKSSRKTKPQGRQKEKKRSANDEDEAPEQPPPTIIFCARARTAAYLTYLLKSLSIRSTALHSRLTQRERLNSLSLFRASVVPVLISTDVGARGLDIEEVAIVINWDMPSEPEEYTHRVGRTARAGRGGMAVSFVTERDEERVLKIEERIKTRLTEMILPEETVLEKLNKVSTAKRVAKMELHDSNFGKREEIHSIKQAKLDRDRA